MDATRRRVTLTFDNGPTPGVTDDVLDVLRDHELAAVFFVIGNRFETPGGRRLVHRAHDEGHRIGNHTWSHSVPLGRLDDVRQVDDEIDRTQAALGDLADNDKLFRPYGSGGVIDRNLIGLHGRQRLLDDSFTCSLWNCLPRDWLDPEGWVETAIADIEHRPWSVVVLHDVATGAMARLAEFLEHLERTEVEFTDELPDDCTPIRRGEPTTSFAMLPV
jgi:peptidoglycan/xylan/chitin deacetylase (PgdA/CDA1 family)